IVAAAAALRPMVSGPVALAQALGASHLGELKLNRGALNAADEATVACIVARARRLDADTVMFVGARPSMHIELLSIAVGGFVTHGRRRVRREHQESSNGSHQVETTPTKGSAAHIDGDLDEEVARLTQWADLQTRPK